MFIDKTNRDIAKFTAGLKTVGLATGLAQLNDKGCEDLVLGLIENISTDIVLEGIDLDRPSGATVNWSHSSGGGMRSTFVSFLD